ncbi:bifunctional enzyme CysN/CysC [Rhodoligotrophos appendicifer]|uniref:sulfate adenylyltransferase subunit CysN n=1 Tax=Rhodoligotrophos appendicifer TaxID=987056 RepID=UPI001186D382|nr:sulfate adenylyltransferase subunit CysN [Rhodoligotrophos appendicifer]
MADTASLDAHELLDRILAAEDRKGLLRFITCGSVDDGKSTLIGRLLYDAELVLEDHLAALANESVNRAVTQDGFDFSLLVDGLQAEREQGITIDVAYRFFATAKRKFIVADTPGHEQYTRNMVTGASNADLAVILIDARKGVLTQTRRHSYICALLGIRDVVVAVNKMDLVDYSEAAFRDIEEEFEAFAAEIGLPNVQLIPVSALMGDNIASSSSRMAWYDGPALLDFLETVIVDDERERAAVQPLRFPVQWVNRPDLDFRGFSGTIAAGTVTVGDTLMVTRSRTASRVRRIATFDGDLHRAQAGDAVTIELADEIDVSRGDMLAHETALPALADQLQAHLVWMAEDEMIPGRSYILEIGHDRVPASVTELKHRVDVNTLERAAAKTLALNGVGVVNIATDRPIAFDPYAENRTTGSFILVDRISNATVGAGMIDFALRRATNIAWQSFDIDRAARAGQKRQSPAILWFTGLSGSGKSTIANLVEKRLYAEGKHLYVLDGDNVRHGLNRDLGFTDADRVENIRRVAEVARLMAEAGLIVLVSFISPFRRERRMAREIAGDVPFLEVYVDTPIEICEQRDPKGLYAKARAGAIANFTGIDSPYEAPEKAEIIIHGGIGDPEDHAAAVIEAIDRSFRAGTGTNRY